MLVKDAMVLIHLAKTSHLAESLDRFDPVLVPPGVLDEVLVGKAHGHADAVLVEDQVDAGRLTVVPVQDEDLAHRARQLGLQGGEAEAVALCWQEDVGRLATDDDNVRRKEALLGLEIVGTPAIMLTLFREGRVDRVRFLAGLDALERVGWFHPAVLDRVRREAS